MGNTYILVETEEKRQTLHAAVQGTGEVMVVPPMAAKVEVKKNDQLFQGKEGFLFRPTPAGHDTLKKLLQGGRKDIYLAFDCSERGEYSSWLWAGMIGQLTKGVLQCRRLHLASLDEQGLTKAMELVEPINAEQAAFFYFEECFQRSLAAHLDRLLGTCSGPGGVSLSIPVITMLTLLAERDHELSAYSGTPGWHVQLSLQGPKGAVSAQLKEGSGGEEVVFEGLEQAREVVDDLTGQLARVVARHENSLEIPAPEPYTLYELVFDAFRYCQIPVGPAMRAAATLFTGVTLGSQRQALISSLYPGALRTMQPFVEKVQQYVDSQYGSESLQRRPLVVDGIIPLNPQIRPEDLSELSDVQQKIYDLIWCRALASQMQEAKGKEIIVEFEIGKYRLQSEFRVLEDSGFLQVYQYGFEALLAAGLDDVPQEGDGFEVVKLVPEQRLGMAPALYTLPGLADELTDFSFGGQQEVVDLFGKLCDADYIKGRENGTLQCGPNLFKVVNALNRAFPGMQGLSLVVYYAQTIEEVVSGRKAFHFGLTQFDQNLVIQGKSLLKVKAPAAIGKPLKTSKRIIKGGVPALVGKPDMPAPIKEDETLAAEGEDVLVFPDLQGAAGPPEAILLPDVDTEMETPNAEGEVSLPEEEEKIPRQDEEANSLDVEAEEQVGMVTAAAEEQVFQDVEEELTASAPSPPEEKAAPAEPGLVAEKEERAMGLEDIVTKPCPQCDRAMILKADQFGEYWACTGIPACRHTEGVVGEVGGESVLCPLCQKAQLEVKRTPMGKDMYVCPLRACEFMAWSKPHAIHCPLCSSPFLVEKKKLSGDTVLRCPKASCNYSQGMADSEKHAAPVKKKVVVRRKQGSSAGGGKRRVVVRRKK